MKTPLHYASKNANSAMCSLLLSYNVPINFQDDKGRTPLHYALMELSKSNEVHAKRYNDVCILLIESNADLSLKNDDIYF